MFDIGWSELLVIAVVAIIVVGPKDLPRLMRTFGHYVGKLRHMASDFQRQFEEVVRDSEIDEVRKAMQEFHGQASAMDLRAPVDKPPMVPKPTPAPAETPAPTKAAEHAPKPKPKPRAKKPKTAKTAAAKTTRAKTAVAETDQAKPKGAAPKPRARKREESAS
jgi:sec-independent protein translocase protein TatB